MQATKVIFKGRFDFGSPETVARIVRQLETRLVNLYKEDLPWSPAMLFPENTSEVKFMPVSMQVQDRTWKHGLDALNWFSQFALCGEVLAIRLGADRSTERIEPVSEKAAVLLFRHAREESCPLRRGELLDQVLDRYPDHTEALLARADLAMEREDLATAFLDLDAAGRRDPDNPALCYRLARHDYLLGKWDDALVHIDRTVTFSMPLEEIHWQGRMLRARIWKAMLQCEQALQEWATLEARLEKDAALLPGLLAEVRRQQADCRALLDTSGLSQPGGAAPAAKGKVPA